MIRLSATNHNIQAAITLSGSKSISNRLLILTNVLGLTSNFENCSDSEDTRVLKNALLKIQSASLNQKVTINIGHAGTDMRFLTALLSMTPGEWFLTGSERMMQRPIGELVKALQNLGATIAYIGEAGFPPLKISGKKLKGGRVSIPGNISSQFISSLLLISPSLENGLELTLTDNVVSKPYIDMTLALLELFNIRIEKKENQIVVTPSIVNTPSSMEIESDWSSASYWYSICALAKEARIELKFLNAKSVQADAILPILYRPLGVETRFENNTVVLTKKEIECKQFEYDFQNCPDIAQTVAVTCFALGIPAYLSGLSTLKLKESDRIIALKNELEKLGARVYVGQDFLELECPKQKPNCNPEVRIRTYNDHRMAMSFAPLSLLLESLIIEDPDVVSKSYPRFWEDLKSVGFNVNLQP